MNIEIKYQPSYSLAIIRLDRGEGITAEAGAMVSMSDGISINTQMKGGLFGALKRTVLGGESLFFNQFTSELPDGEITLAPTLPGDIMTTPVNGTIYLQSGSFLAATPEIDIDTKWGGAKTFFGSEGLFLLKATGQGQLIASSYGAIHKVNLMNRRFICDTGHVVAFSQGIDFDVRPVGGLKSTVLSGEGLVCEFRGQGDLWIQTRSTQALLSWLIPRLPGRGREGGRGAGSMIGNLLRG
ncbi:MAG: TIGR00266 family protein [Candidatus Eisenbacteria bacterium]|uniref:TIGR00266 family protein n=1 Tax=Eiseniibacteriota bacterium TaxID=2212470 RepID=A0A948RXJ1_UNCEI|nr:TIGR00266 family protein [Candidatus Eisenbacteria bacterium]MBU1947870.1 TIGR00266 family protein [Candidatus Eisenbacteria bacterium]MBU2690897.1 TIGR00266 family protein [Candidatus Eisenbacteria bacterium]